MIVVVIAILVVVVTASGWLGGLWGLLFGLILAGCIGILVAAYLRNWDLRGGGIVVWVVLAVALGAIVWSWKAKARHDEPPTPPATTSGQAGGAAPASAAAPAAPQLPLLLRFAEGDAEGCQEILISWSARVTPLGGPVAVHLPGPGGKPADKPAGGLHPDRPGEVNFGTVETGVWRFCPEDDNASWGVEVGRR